MSVDPVRSANPRRAVSFRPPMWDKPATNQDTAAKHDESLRSAVLASAFGKGEG
jgi:hypothetical protein